MRQIFGDRQMLPASKRTWRYCEASSFYSGSRGDRGAALERAPTIDETSD